MKIVDEKYQNFFDAIEYIASDFGYQMRSYSGRGMFGSQCLSINVDRGFDEVKFGAYVMMRLLANDESAHPDDFPMMRSDSMGLGSVIYWPRVEVIADDNEDEED